VDITVVIQTATFLSLIAGFLYTWFREGRARQWQLADAKEMASKLSADTAAMAAKVNSDAIAIAARVNQDAATMAAKVIEDAEKLAAKVHDSAEKLANKVAENTEVSTAAARGAKEAYTEANTINAKIADLNAQLLVVSDYIRRAEEDDVTRAKASQAEAEFNARVKIAIEEKLRELNGPPAKRLRQPKSHQRA
jgi:D-Tyr-tRNAtyr deacylase